MTYYHYAINYAINFFTTQIIYYLPIIPGTIITWYYKLHTVFGATK